ncbi:MAG: nitroreductase family deazaflavin-dependent oxidoreductase [Ktedonobacteraceae bacterium]|nr:nitroreductase family deazaflavin-dependent oxidoreductase [Ktedonobacteraceae bacterium]
MTNANLDQLKNEDFCYLTTTGRISGRPHSIEIWFALEGKTLYMLAGGRDSSDWVKNARKLPIVQVKIGESVFSGRARVVENGEEDKFARKLVFDKYTPRDSDDLTEWSLTSLPVAVDLEA